MLEKTSSISLKKLQSLLKDFIFSHEENMEKQIFFSKNFVLPLREITVPLAQKIHKGNHLEALKLSLKESFPVCAQFLTEKVFNKLVFNYARSFPSRSPFLSSYGSQFPFFLKKNLLNQEFPFLSDLAHFELKIRQLMLEEEEEASSLSSLICSLQKEGEDCQLRRVESTSLFHSSFPIYDLWQHLKHNAKTNKFSSHPAFLLLIKKDREENKEDQVVIESLSLETYFLAHQMDQGLSLLEIKKKWNDKIISKSLFSSESKASSQSFELLTSSLVSKAFEERFQKKEELPIHSLEEKENFKEDLKFFESLTYLARLKVLKVISNSIEEKSRMDSL